MLREWVTAHPGVVAGVWRLVRAHSAQHPPGQVRRDKALSAHLPPGLQHRIMLLTGLLMADIPGQMIGVPIEHQVPNRGMLLQSKRCLIDPEQVPQQDLILPTKDKELLKSKTIPETEPMLTTVIEIST